MLRFRDAFNTLFIFGGLILLGLSEVSVAQNYEGNLKVFMVEPVSRHNNMQGHPFDYAFLDFAMDTSLDLNSDETYVFIDTFEFQDMSSDNIMAIAAVFNAEGHQEYSYPPTYNPFTAHWLDAAAGAFPGESGRDEAFGGLNHTVIMEDVSPFS